MSFYHIFCLEKRYVSSIEAYDKILGFQRLGLSHVIIRLQIHLPDRQSVVFTAQRLGEVAANPPPTTMLTAFFQLNMTDRRANEYLYLDIVNQYTYNKSSEWTERVNMVDDPKVIGRLPFIYNKNDELFHLKLLLMHVRGPTSFEFLRTVNGRVYETFTDAAKSLNLVENSQQWVTMMDEIVRTELPYRIRYFIYLDFSS